MIDVVFRHAWMQKHPTPTTAGGDYHWHPASTPAGIRSTLADLAQRTGASASSVWVVGPDAVAWARTFSAVAPSDRRRYAGIAAVIAQPAGDTRDWGAALPEVLHRLQLAPAGPLQGAGPEPRTVSVDAAAPMQPIDAASVRDVLGGAEAREGFARAAVFGGAAVVPAPSDERLPSLAGALLSWLPPHERAAAARTGSLSGEANGVVAKPPSEGARSFVHYLARAWSGADRRAAGSAWRLVLDLAAARGATLRGLFDELATAAGAWDTADNLARYLVASGVLSTVDVRGCDERAPRPLCDRGVADAGWLWNRLLNYWGRGFFGDADRDLIERLGGLLAMRIAADHLFHLDAPEQPALPERYLRRLRYESLLTRTRVAAMTDQLQRYLPSLEALRER